LLGVQTPAERFASCNLTIPKNLTDEIVDRLLGRSLTTLNSQLILPPFGIF
jgi:hypothetical protein